MTGLPENVTLDRFGSLVRDSGARWGLRASAYTPRVSGRRDGYSVVGFGLNVPGGALAVQRDYVMRSYRVQKRCRLRAGRRACRAVRRLVRQRVVERDVTVRPDAPWQAGPAYPGPEEFDLETVLIHELGHSAGNPRHVRRCTNSPLMVSLGPGEWWHTSEDWHVDGCGIASAAAADSRRGFVRQRLLASR